MKKIHIYTKTELLSEIKTIIATENRLDELITILPIEYIEEYPYSIIIENDIVRTFPLWDSTKPPILLPEVVASDKQRVLGIIFFLLSNYEKASYYFDNDELLKLCAETCLDLLTGKEITFSSYTELTKHRQIDHTILHNQAIANHYGNANIGFPEINDFYTEALSFGNTSDDRLVYTARQYAVFLGDAKQYNQAIDILETYKKNLTLSSLAKINTLAFLSHLRIKTLSQPYDQSSVKQIKSDLSECLKYLKEEELFVDEAFVLMDASYITMIGENYSEALSYIQRAISLFEDAEVYELAANARLQKSDLLFTWAQCGNPQFYKAAMTACLEALEVFKREETPEIFADVHHKLGVIYSEILDDEKKRSIWTSVSLSSFKEALQFFNKEDYPYEYALICHNQGNAYTKYPPTIHSDNYAKAMDWYKQSLDIRSADKYPTERAITLLNYIEAAWNLSIDSDFDKDLFNDMMQKAQEITNMQVNSELIEEANRHINQLKELSATAENK